jgi:hypothetical protein
MKNLKCYNKLNYDYKLLCKIGLHKWGMFKQIEHNMHDQDGVFLYKHTHFDRLCKICKKHQSKAL